MEENNLKISLALYIRLEFNNFRTLHMSIIKFHIMSKLYAATYSVFDSFVFDD